MKKSDLVETVYRNLNCTIKEADKAVSIVFELMKDTIESGHRLKITGFGSFVPRTRPERNGRNPQTGEIITLPEYRYVSFKPSLELKKSVNLKKKH